MRIRSIVVLAAVIVAAAVLAWMWWPKSTPRKVSGFGQYRGYSGQRFDGVLRRSNYLALHDGTRLAYELILPTLDGKPAAEPLPVLFKYTPYLRTWTIFDAEGHNRIADFIDMDWKMLAMLRVRYWFAKDGHLLDPLTRTPWLKRLVGHGYAVVVVERPGTGASFGVMNPAFEANLREIDQILDWIAAQPWSDGKVGMYGDSFQAMVQIPAAATGNPHLKAIFPASAPFELYDSVSYRGGVFNRAFSKFFAGAAAHLETLVTPVDTDPGGILLAQAQAERKNATLGQRVDLSNERYAFRDGTTPSGAKPWEATALHAFIGRMNAAGVPAYFTTGWYDIFAGGGPLWHANLAVPRRLTIRAVDHTGVEEPDTDLDMGAEAHRWFDYWLKGIQNGIMEEAPIHYALMRGENRAVWRTAREWPLAGTQALTMHLQGGKSGTIGSANDGALAPTPADDGAASDAYTVNYGTTTGPRSRWTAVNFPRAYPDMRGNDAKALTYTSGLLASDVEVIGSPVVALWLASRAPDLDAFVYLERVDRDGTSTYVTEGTLRASHRRQREAPFDNLGLPFHSHLRTELAGIPPEEPFEVRFALLPTAFVFPKGTRVRVTVAFSDRDNFDTPELNPPPVLRLLRNVNHPSRIVLPVGGRELDGK